MKQANVRMAINSLICMYLLRKAVLITDKLFRVKLQKIISDLVLGCI